MNVCARDENNEATPEEEKHRANEKKTRLARSWMDVLSSSSWDLLNKRFISTPVLCAHGGSTSHNVKCKQLLEQYFF